MLTKKSNQSVPKKSFKPETASQPLFAKKNKSKTKGISYAE